jgi:hypothetical protein
MSGLQWSDAKRYLQDLEAVLGGQGGSDNADALSALRAARVELQSIFTASQLNGKAILSGTLLPAPRRSITRGHTTN